MTNTNESDKTKTFKSYPLEQRIEEAKRIRAKYPDRIPVIIDRHPNNTSVPTIDKQKYLLPEDMVFSQFMHIIRKRIKLTSQQAIFIFINDKIPTGSTKVSDLYKEYKDEDGFLYAFYAGENAYGN
jgi:GABA(A) receptor-associated protein